MEHRCGQRTPVNLLVRLTGLADVIGMGRLRNVSASGAFLQTSLELPLLSTVRIELIGRTRHASSYLAGRAYVARKEAGGVGIERIHACFAVKAASVREDELQEARTEGVHMLGIIGRVQQ